MREGTVPPTRMRSTIVKRVNGMDILSPSLWKRSITFGPLSVRRRFVAKNEPYAPDRVAGDE
jgi:hypothetical protein